MKNTFTLFVLIVLLEVQYSFAQYCPCFSSGGSCCITNVTFNTLNNTTTGCTAGNYSLQPGSTNLLIGNTYTFSVTLSSIGKASVWIDFNHNFTFEASEWFQPFTNALTGSVSIPVPINSAYGPLRMRVRSCNTVYSNGPNDACNTIFTGETEDYNVTILPGVNYDPAIYAMSTPSGNCFSSSTPMAVRVTNYGALPINLSTNPITVTLYVNAPSGLITMNTVLSSGTLSCCALDTMNVLFNVNLFAGGTYTLNTSLSIVNSGGVNNPILSDDSLSPPITLVNKRPVPNPPFVLCQGSPIPFGQGLGVSGCTTPLQGTSVITFTVTPCVDNVGATAPGSNIGPPSNCSNQYACTFASGTLPALPPGAYFTQPGVLTITHLNSAFPDEVRFNLFGAIPNGPTLFSACPTPYNVGSNDINVGGFTIGTQPNFTYVRNISPTSLSAIYSNLTPGSILNVGYFEMWNDTFATADCYANAQNQPTVVTLSIPYQYTPSSIEWYDVPVGGSSLYGLSPYNPFTTPNTVVNNSNTVGTYVFYAACSGTSTCRTPDTLIIKPSPIALQDSMALCENAVASNTAVFNLTSLNAGISGGQPYDSIEYYYDQALVSELPYPTSDTTGNTIHFSKMYLNGCYSSDSIVVEVNSLPDIQLISNVGLACIPNSIDITSLINPFSSFPAGTDTLFFSDPACTLPYPNPMAITSNDSVYIVAVTNAVPACKDTILATVQIGGTDSFIVNQNTFNASECSGITPIPPVSYTLMDGTSQEYQNPINCRRIVHISDVANGTSLGVTTVNEEVDCSTQNYNGQYYLKRHFKVEATQPTSAQVCLYFLQDDVDEFNQDASNAGQLPFTSNLSNLCISKIDNGDLNDPNHTWTVIDSSIITKVYDPIKTIWTVCFPVDSFSSFYCHVCNLLNAALPVTLMDFSGRNMNKVIELFWTTQYEKNLDYYVLERSANGKLFDAISEPIPGQGGGRYSPTELHYHYTDLHPLQGNNYYRLRMMDKDGKESKSQVIHIPLNEGFPITVYPNPAQEVFHIRIISPITTKVKMELFDMTGRLISSYIKDVLLANNEFSIPVGHLEKGNYLLNVTINGSLEKRERVVLK